jgi:hypothetical protein
VEAPLQIAVDREEIHLRRQQCRIRGTDPTINDCGEP